MTETALNSSRHTSHKTKPKNTSSGRNLVPRQSEEHPRRKANQAFDDALTDELPTGSLPLADFERLTEDYLRDCEYRMQSPATIEVRRVFIKNLLWFLKEREFTQCDTYELRQFLTYLQNGHKEPGGRWGNSTLTKAVRPITVKDYYVNLRCLFNWLVEDGMIEVSPLEKIPKPKIRVEQVQPFTQNQIEALLKAARATPNPRRNEAIVLFLYDTGVRASELCGLTMRDLDLNSRHACVLGKGNKRRLVYFSRETAKVLSAYLRKSKRDLNDPVFISCAGTTSGAALTRSGLRQLIETLGKMAGIKGQKVSPHVFRHSAAIQLLRNGCDVYSLMSLMGHTSLSICQNYLKLSQLDLEHQYEKCSPVDSLSSRKKRESR